MSEAIFSICDADCDGFLHSSEMLKFLQACEEGTTVNDSAAIQRIRTIHGAIGNGVTGLGLELLQNIFANPKRFNYDIRYAANSFEKIVMNPSREIVKQLRAQQAAAKQTLTAAADLAEPAENSAKRKEKARDKAIGVFQTAEEEAQRHVEQANNIVQSQIVRIYGAMAEKARREKQAAQAKADASRSEAESAKAAADKEKANNDATAASCKNKAWDASVNWLEMKIREQQRLKQDIQVSLKADKAEQERQLEISRTNSIRCRRIAEHNMVIAHKKKYTEKKRAADEAATAQQIKTKEILADVETQIAAQLERRKNAEIALADANGHAKAVQLMSVHSDLIPMTQLLHDEFDEDKDGHLRAKEFLRFARSIGRDLGQEQIKKRSSLITGRENHNVSADIVSSDQTLEEIYQQGMFKCSNGLTLPMLMKLYREGIMKHDVDTDYRHLFD